MERKPSSTAAIHDRTSSRMAAPPAQIQANKLHGYGIDEVEPEDLPITYSDFKASAEDSCRERLKRLRVEMSGRVWIPEMWGQEALLKDWIDSKAFDASLFPGEIGSARAALVEEGRKANSGRLRIENRC